MTNKGCAYCGASLDDVRKMHLIKNHLYCSKACAVAGCSSYILSNLHELANERYDKHVTIVDRGVRGLSAEEILRTITALRGLNKRCDEWLSYFTNMSDDEQASCLASLEQINFPSTAALLNYIGG